MNRTVRCEQLGAVERRNVTAVIRYASTCFLDDELSGGDVPGVEPAFPKPVEPAGRNVAEVERRRSVAPHGLRETEKILERREIGERPSHAMGGKAGDDQRVEQSRAIGDPQRASVAIRAAPRGGAKALVRHRVVHHAEPHGAGPFPRDRNAEQPITVCVVHRAVERIDDPSAASRIAARAAFFPEDRLAGIGARYGLLNERLALGIGLGHEIAAHVFRAHADVRAEFGFQERACQPRRHFSERQARGVVEIGIFQHVNALRSSERKCAPPWLTTCLVRPYNGEGGCRFLQLVEAFVSQMLGRPVMLASNGASRRIGKVEDLAIASAAESFPAVTGVYIKSSDGGLRYAPFGTVRAMTEREVVLGAEPLPLDRAAIPAGQLRLAQDLQDKQIVDVDGHKVVRVNDLKLAPAGESLRLIAADVGLSGIFRRLGLMHWGRKLDERASRTVPNTLISWDAVQPLAHDPAEPIRLRVPQDRIDRIHPADLAGIIQDLNASDQAALVESLDEELAADAFEQLDSQTQLSILEDLKPDRAADIIENMAHDDAADLLGEVDPETQANILRLMEPEDAKDVRELLRHDESTAGGLMTTEYLSVPPGLVIADALAHIRNAADDAELVYYIYVIDADNRILGVLSLRDLIRARPETPVKDVMVDDVVTVPLDASREEVATTIARYDFIAVPVVDGLGRMQGIVTVDDAIDVLLPEKLRKMLPRVGRSRSKDRIAPR